MTKEIQQRKPFVIVAALALAVLLVWPAWIATQNFISDLYARPAIDYLEEKRSGAYAISQAEWLAIENIVTQADDLMPGNPRYLEALGFLQQLKPTVFDEMLLPEEGVAPGSAAKVYFLEALENRPTWPYYWGNLALEHYHGGNYAAAEFSLALANAARFGPWKNDMQRLVIDLGSETLAFLSPPAQREFLLSVERGLQRQPTNTVQIIRDNGDWSAVCEASGAVRDVGLPYLQTLCDSERFAQ